MGASPWRLAAAAAIVVSACAPADEPSAPGVAVVQRVVDGDTVEVRVSGRDETVRLIGIDTPETKHPTVGVECYGPEASEHLSSLLPPDTEVRLERDVEARDRYGRLLAYVHRRTDDLFVNRAMAEGGFADAAEFPPNVARTDEIASAVASARSQGTGLWSACGGPDVPADGAR